MPLQDELARKFSGAFSGGGPAKTSAVELRPLSPVPNPRKGPGMMPPVPGPTIGPNPLPGPTIGPNPLPQPLPQPPVSGSPLDLSGAGLIRNQNAGFLPDVDIVPNPGARAPIASNQGGQAAPADPVLTGLLERMAGSGGIERLMGLIGDFEYGGQRFNLRNLGDLLGAGGLGEGDAGFLQDIYDRGLAQRNRRHQGGGGDAGGGGGGGGRGRGGGGGGGGGGRYGGYLRELIEGLMENPGFDPEILARMHSQAESGSKVRERDRVTRRGEDFAARGLFGSGLQGRSIQGIEAQESEALLGSKNQIEFANAQAAVQSISQAIEAINSGINQQLGNKGLNIQRMLGLGNLDLGRSQLGLQASLQEWMQNMMMMQNYLPQQAGGGGIPGLPGAGGGGMNPADRDGGYPYY